MQMSVRTPAWCFSVLSWSRGAPALDLESGPLRCQGPRPALLRRTPQASYGSAMPVRPPDTAPVPSARFPRCDPRDHPSPQDAVETRCPNAGPSPWTPSPFNDGRATIRLRPVPVASLIILADSNKKSIKLFT